MWIDSDAFWFRSTIVKIATSRRVHHLPADQRL